MNSSLRRASLALVLLCITLGALTACFPLAVGGAVMGGMVAADRRTAGSVLEDEGIELRSGSRIREALGDRGHVNVTSYNRQVLLTGEVGSAQDKQLVEQIVSGVDNVRNIVNELAILGTTTLSQRSNDSLVTGRVKAGLVDASDLSANAFKITTERGTTYVMGRVTAREAKRATEVISGTSGVQRVVRILETISEEELARFQAAPPPRAAAKP
ncbi:MAG TPA: BON domain-containing protein [Rhodoferax sp.]|jgi:osmotically-inducible protein OsmY|nr:BON domain-containing protein [Rhodoferax sp.]HPW30477.1 BON domain-containing protein [Rhodoferax sp.]